MDCMKAVACYQNDKIQSSILENVYDFSSLLFFWCNWVAKGMWMFPYSLAKATLKGIKKQILFLKCKLVFLLKWISY